MSDSCHARSLSASMERSASQAFQDFIGHRNFQIFYDFRESTEEGIPRFDFLDNEKKLPYSVEMDKINAGKWLVYENFEL